MDGWNWEIVEYVEKKKNVWAHGSKVCEIEKKTDQERLILLNKGESGLDWMKE